MTLNSVGILLVLSLCVPRVTGTVNGNVGAWIQQTFCTGIEYRTLPWDCFGYLHCEQSGPSHWSNCGRGEKFDMTTLKCQDVSTTCQDPELAAYKYCPTHPDLNFAHPKSCAMYYDCSVTFPKPGLKKYENECIFPALFDHVNAVCRPHTDQNPMPCTNIPTSKCDYVLDNSPDCKSAACAGLTDGLHPDPLTMADYFPRVIMCSLGKVTESYTCSGINEVFDVASRICTTNHTLAIKNFCVKFPKATFADPDNCAMYYDCSATQHHTVPMEDYLTECKYIHLYDPKTRSCLRYNEITNQCGAKKVPLKPCEYRLSDCQAERPCFPCSAICVGLPDGANPYPGYKNTRFYLICEGQRTLDYKECTHPHIFLPGLRRCGKRGDDVTDKGGSSTDNCVGSRPTCAADLKIFEEDINELFAKTVSLTKKVNEKQSPRVTDPYGCSSPPKVLNSIVKLSYTPDSAQATYQCIEGYTACGGELSSTCSSLNTWSDVTGSCVQSVWTDIINMNPVIFKCPFREGSILSIRGRYTGNGYGLSILANNTTENVYLTILISPRADSQNTQFGSPGSLTIKDVPVYEFHNRHDWRVTFNKNNFDLALNGYYIGMVAHSLDLNNEVFKLARTGNFKVETVQIHPKEIMVDKGDSLSINLAYKQTATSSSSTTFSTPAQATDGDHGIVWSGDHCWSSKTGDLNPWWMVDLGQTFVVSNLVITTPDCASCGTLHDFTIHVAMDKDLQTLNDANLCFKYIGKMPANDITKVTCARPLMGRYVTIKRTSRYNDLDTMAFCEVEVYGGRVPTTGLRPFTCPPPPVLPHATVHVGYTSKEAVATYTCHHNYISCNSRNILYCNSERGWDTKPHPCIKALHNAVFESVKPFPICPLHLGSGIEFWFTATQNNGFMSLEDQDRDATWKIPLRKLQLNDVDKPALIAEDIVKPSPIIKDKEHHLVVSMLSDHILIEIDGRHTYKYPSYKTNTAMAVDIANFSSSIFVKKARIHERIFDVVRESVHPDHYINFAFFQPASSSSNQNNPPSYAFDNDLADYAAVMGTCWHPAVGDNKPWIQVDLQGLFFIKKFSISIHNYHPGHDTINIAQSKPAVGSPNVDIKSSPAFAVDGNAESDYTKGSCFSTSSDQSWWMVDLQGSFLIKEIVLHGRTDAFVERFEDVTVFIYDKNPETDSTATEQICHQYFGRMAPNQTLACYNSMRGRYVKVKKQGPHLTLCEVQVFAELSDRLHDFELKVYDTLPEVSTGKLCYKMEGEMTVEKMSAPCNEDVVGRYVRLEGSAPKTDDDLMTVCEMEVFVDRMVKKAWTPQDCPEPPGKSEYVVTYTSQKATAKYSCPEEFTRFTPGDTITCSSIDGWVGEPAICSRSTFHVDEKYEPQSPVSTMYLSSLFRLGEAVEMMFTPKSEGWKISLIKSTNGNRMDMSVTMNTRYPSTGTMEVSSHTTTQLQLKKTVQTSLFKLNTEARIVVTFLSDGFDIAVNDVYLMSFPMHKFEPHVTKIETSHGILRVVYHKHSSQTVGVKKPLLKSSLVGPEAQVTSSSDYGPDYLAINAVDGTYLDQISKCWMAAKDDPEPFLHIDLKDYFYIDHVVVTSKSHCISPVGGACEDITRDILVTVLHKDIRDSPMLCALRKGVVPFQVSEIIRCQPGVRGRYVQLSGKDRREKTDMFTLCEVQIFGGRILRDGLAGPQYQCPQPTVIPYAELSVQYTSKEAVARYVCSDGYIGCPGSSGMIRCDGIHGWVETHFTCIQATFYEEDDKGLSEVNVPCTFRLGRAIELYFTPSFASAPFTFESDKIILLVNIVGRSMSISNDKSSNIKWMHDVDFVEGKEAKIVLSFLSSFLEVTVDDRLVFVFDTTEELSAVKKITASGGRLRKVRVKEDSEPAFVKNPIQASLAAGKEVTVSTIARVDLMADALVDSKSNTSWSAATGDLTPHVIIKLSSANYYYIESVIITTRVCAEDCKDGVYDILITASHDATFKQVEVCKYHQGDILPDTRLKLFCQKEVRGRYIKLEGQNRRLSDDALAFAEIEVLGGELIREPWTPDKCPKPPLLPNAEVVVKCTENQAIATYTCLDSFTRCRGRESIIHCTGYDGWKGIPKPCVRNVFRSEGPNGLDSVVLPCMFKLGEAIEMIFDPDSGSEVQFMTDSGQAIFGIMLLPSPSTGMHGLIEMKSYNDTINTVAEKVVDDVVFFKNNPKKIVVTFLTENLDIAFDGRFVASFESKIQPPLFKKISIGGGVLHYVKIVSASESLGTKRPLAENLALTSDTATASSSTPTSGPENAVDGELKQDIMSGAKCFLTTISDSDPYILVHLNDYYYIDRVVVWSRDCTGTCAQELHHVYTDVYHKNPNLFSETPDVCMFREDVIPPKTHMSFRCDSHVRGRYVKLGTNQPSQNAVLGICELQIFGGSIIRKSSTPFNCPNPSPVSNTVCRMTTISTQVNAYYPCIDGYSRCDTGSEEDDSYIYCEGYAGWKGSLEQCVKTTIVEDTETGLPGIVRLPCKFRLGQGLEFFVTPLIDVATISFVGGDTLIFEIVISQADTTTIELKATNPATAIVQSKRIPGLNYPKGKEIRIVLTFLTGGIDLEIDGAFIDFYNLGSDSAKMKQVNGDGVRMRKFRYVPVSQSIAVSRAVSVSLGRQMEEVTSSSLDNTAGSVTAVVDGNYVKSLFSNSCWMAAFNDVDPHIQIKLKDYFYIDYVKVTTRDDKGICSANCSERAHDVAVTVFHATDDVPQLCYYREGVIPAGTTERITCKSRLRGRYIKLRGMKRRSPSDQLTFCEIDIFGGGMIREKATPVPPVDPCPAADGYIFVESPRLCFKLNANRGLSTYENAKLQCAASDGRLINLDTAEKYNYIVNHLTHLGSEAGDISSSTFRMWVGMKKTQGVPKWSTGSAYLHAGSVNNDPLWECIVLKSTGLSDLQCTEVRRFVCEIPLPRPA